MAIQPTDLLTALTNAQCATLRDDLVELLVTSGLSDPTVRNLKRRVKIGIDYVKDKKDEKAEKDQIEVNNLALQAHEAIMRPIRERRALRQQIDYGAD